jgi:hypothetical protein
VWAGFYQNVAWSGIIDLCVYSSCKKTFLKVLMAWQNFAFLAPLLGFRIAAVRMHFCPLGLS